MNLRGNLNMSSENRDFVIERLEKQVAEKDNEIKKIKNSLKDSIIEEIHQEIDVQNVHNNGKGDVDELKKRVDNLEDKVKELGKTLDGMMEELLDQKSVLKSLENQSQTPHTHSETINSSKTESLDSDDIKTEAIGNSSESKISEYTRRFTGKNNQNIHTNTAKKQELEPEQPQNQSLDDEIEESDESEYIIAESGDKKPHKNKSSTYSSEYIIAESGEKGSSKKGRPKRQSKEYIVADGQESSSVPEKEEKENVESREDEDAEIITNNK